MLEMTLQIRPSDYLERAEAADRILGGSVSKALFLVFEGSFAVSAGGKTVDEPFSCQMEIPLATQGSFYEISPPQPDVKAGQITQTETRILPVRGKRIAVGAARNLRWHSSDLVCAVDDPGSGCSGTLGAPHARTVKKVWKPAF